jgi:ubiquinone/menaquinone biosynthesis C-methylase UbiE
MITDKRGFDELKDQLRQPFLAYLNQAFQHIPPVANSWILDIGCGSGVPTMELARISGGEVTAIDIDREALQRLREKVETAGLSTRIHIVEGSLKKMDFPAETFDILWAEGSIFVIGFNKGLKAWKRFIKPNGYLVVHDAAENLDKKIQDIPSCGYKLVEWFALEDDFWWLNYYKPLRREIQQIRQSNPTDHELAIALDQAEKEIQGYSKHPWRYQSVYFIMCNKGQP